jgi:transposase
MRRPVYDRRFVDSFNQIDALEGAKRRPALKKNSNTRQGRKQTELPKAPRLKRSPIVGVDVGDKNSHYCILGPEGEIAAEGILRTTPAGFSAQFSRATRCRIVLEVGTHSPWISRLLGGLGHEVIVANAGRVRMIYDNDNKNDRVDARTLARLARVDTELLHPVRHRSAEAQADLAILHARDCVVSLRTKLVNTVRSMVKSFGSRLPSGSPEYFPRKVRSHIPASLQPALFPLLEQMELLTSQIRAYDKQVEQLSRTRYPKTQLIQQIRGVGALTSLAFVLTIDDPHRFQKSRDVGSYLGLRPRRDDSGQSRPQLSITKAGNHFLRRLLVNCAHYTLGHFGMDSDLRRWGQALMARGGKNAKKRAIVAVARKLAVLMHSLWVSGEVYEPLRKQRDAHKMAA